MHKSLNILTTAGIGVAFVLSIRLVRGAGDRRLLVVPFTFGLLASTQALWLILDQTSAGHLPFVLMVSWHLSVTVTAILGIWYFMRIFNERQQALSSLQQSERRFRDLSAHLQERVRQRTIELDVLNQELARSNEDLQQFAYIASHDLQEPLRTVGGFVQLLDSRYGAQLDQNAREFIRYAVDGVNRMQQLIDSLLDYSRVGTRTEKFAPTDCGEILKNTEALLTATIQERRAVVTCESLPVVLADETQLAQLFQNLLSNALKFCRDKPPKIHIAARRSKNEWLFSIQDNGIGIEAQYRERIFALFQRLHRRDEYAGTGIGLTICKKIVERHGGRIWVESEVEQGSTFFFTIPDARS